MPRVSRVAVLCGVALAMAVAGAAQRKTPARAERASSASELTKAEEAIARNDFASAEPLLNRIVQAEPQNAVAWFDVGYVLSENDWRDQALTTSQHAVDAIPDLFECNLQLG